MMMAKRILLSTAILALLLGGTDVRAAVRGRALLVDAPHRCKPGELLLCRINGEEKKFEKLVKGQVVDARFSPDGKQIVYGIDGKIKIMDLATRKSRDVGSFAAKFTYFNWGSGEKIYFTDGADLRQIFCLDIKSGKRTMIHKGNKGRSTVSLDGKKAAWVIPPVAAFTGGKQFRFMGGCGGAVSPSGKYLTSNLTTSHKLMGILTFGKDGPSKKPIATVTAPGKFSFNGFYFGRSDDWVCYVLESPKKVSPTSYICYWRTGDHIRISEFGKLCIKDFIDETDVLPAGATLTGISVCAKGPTNTPLKDETVNVGLAKHMKVIGHYTAGGGKYTPQLRDGVTWQVDTSKVVMTADTCKGVSTSGRIQVTARYKGKSASFNVSVLPKLTGNGFKAEYFSDATFTKSALNRIDSYIDFRWMRISSPDKSINGRKPWSARWTGKVNVQTAGEYTFYFMQGEGNDGWLRKDRKYVMGKDGKKICSYGVWVDGKLMITRTKKWNAPWARPKASAPVKLSKGLHSIKVISVDNKTAHPVVAQLYWSGPGIKQSLLGGPYVHSK
jgi:PA14 domain